MAFNALFRPWVLAALVVGGGVATWGALAWLDHAQMERRVQEVRAHQADEFVALSEKVNGTGFFQIETALNSADIRNGRCAFTLGFLLSCPWGDFDIRKPMAGGKYVEIK